MITSRNLEDLVPALVKRAEAHRIACKEEGIDLLIYCTYRDNEAQDVLYNQGRMAAGAIVTNARGGESMHNYRIAYDCVGLVNGKPAWNDDRLSTRIGVLGEQVGLTWSGRWSGKLKEKAHFQYTGSLTTSEIKQGKIPL